jgi:hypothetical protein
MKPRFELILKYTATETGPGFESWISINPFAPGIINTYHIGSGLN